MSWWNPWSWGKNVDTEEYQNVRNPIIESPRRPRQRDWTDQYTINSDLTKGLYHNSYPGFKLAGAMAFSPIAVPIYLMGMPIPKGKDSQADNLAQISSDHIDDFGMIHLMSHRDATCWIWPFWSSELGRDVWEFMPDNTICDIIRDIRTNQILAIITDEQISITTAYNNILQVRRRRTFTRESVKIEWLEGSAAIPGGLQGGVFKNVTGEMPIAFANNRDGDEVRGHSDYERILSDLKNYHDTDLALSETLTKFNVKMVQEVDNVDDWKSVNGITTLNELNIHEIDFILNRTGREKTSFEFPERAETAYIEKMKQIYKKLVQGSGVPEIAWGIKVEGNMASADNQIDALIQFVEDKQRQKNKPYQQLFEATMRLRGLATMTHTQPQPIEISWNALDLLSEEMKSTIFQNFAQGIANLIDAAGITKQQAWKMWKRLYPDVTEDYLEEFITGISDMAKHKAFKDAPYENIIGLSDDES